MANNERTPEPIADIIQRILDLIVRHDYPTLVALTHGNRMSESEIEEELRTYGRSYILPPSLQATEPDVVQVIDHDPPAYNVRFSLWTKEEGRSDLSVELEVELTNNSVEVELINIIVF